MSKEYVPPVVTRQTTKEILDQALKEGKSVQKVIIERYESIGDRLYVLNRFCKEYYVDLAGGVG